MLLIDNLRAGVMLQGCEGSIKLSSESSGRVSFSSAAAELHGDVIGPRKAELTDILFHF